MEVLDAIFLWDFFWRNLRQLVMLIWNLIFNPDNVFFS